MEDTKLHVLDMLDDVAKTRGTNAKSAKVRYYGEQSRSFKQALLYAMDPFRVFRIKKVPHEKDLTYTDGVCNGQGLFDVLDELSKMKGIDKTTRLRIDNYIKDLSWKNRVLFCRLLKKDLRIGLDYKSINKIWEDFIPVYLCGLAHPFNGNQASWPMFIEVKYDGDRCQAHILGEEVEFRTRNGLLILGHDHIREQLLKISPVVRERGVVLDGELMAGRFGKTDKLGSSYIVYDMIWMDEWNARKCDRKFKDRRAELMATVGLLNGDNAPHVDTSHGIYCNTWQEAMAFYERVLADGGEGIMFKLPEVVYIFDRHFGWMKYKPYEDVDLKVVGVEPGKPGTKYEEVLGAFIVEYEGKRINVGSGIPDKLRFELWIAWEKKKSSIIGKTIEIRFTPFTKEQKLTPDGSMLFPRFRKLRPDKD